FAFDVITRNDTSTSNTDIKYSDPLQDMNGLYYTEIHSGMDWPVIGQCLPDEVDLFETRLNTRLSDTIRARMQESGVCQTLVTRKVGAVNSSGNLQVIIKQTKSTHMAIFFFTDSSPRTKSIQRPFFAFVAAVLVIIIGFVWYISGTSRYSTILAQSSTPIGSTVAFSQSEAETTLSGIYEDRDGDVLIARLSLSADAH